MKGENYMSDERETEVREAARAAVGVLQRDGWCQWTLCTPDGRRCMVGSVHVVAAPAVAEEVFDRARRVIGKNLLVAWNDEPRRTVDEVVSVLERVAAGEGASS